MIRLENLKNVSINKVSVDINEPVIIRTSVYPDFSNKKIKVIINMMTEKEFRQMKEVTSVNKNISEWDFQHIIIDQMNFLSPEVDYDEKYFDWQTQNELVKQKLIELGIPEEAITIVEDIEN